MAKPALGKGFDALINQNLSRESLTAPQAGDVVHQLSHAAIIPSSLQPRAIFTPEQLAELVDSIKEHGIIQPLIVRETQSGKYELIAGERRWRASGILGLSTVPAIIREASDKDVLELALIENLQRENLSPLEEAAGYMRLKTEFRMKQGDIAKRVGKSRAAVANSMRLLDLPQPVQDMLGNTFISVGHAKVLLSLKNKDQQIQLGRDIVNKGYTVRQTEKAIQKILNPPEPAPAKKPSSPQYKKISGILAKQFGTPVNISGQGSRGSIEITFSSKAEFIRILELLGQDEWPDSK
ncbi:ParB/RepB/Spo0J family partition protein [uncultured Akkermansia sp.]|uniref:ParB/RepB/Spo0J family partition protein n=1 Tax=uncultured Akkermansia sp. TaxID=512294 RepID=UPI0026127F61|nr:ParB/RepB/Spo0J family partition protein [uncultured Akkermansia sp.]